MKKVILHGDRIKSESDFHREISSALDLVEYYGCNLDALWDCLNYNVERPVLIIWLRSLDSKDCLRGDFERILHVFNFIKHQDVDAGLKDCFDFILQ